MTLEDAIRVANESGVCRTPYTASFFFTSETLLAFARQVETEALEKAAKVCDEQGREWDSDQVVTRKNYAAYCANRIRALPGTTKESP